MTVGISPQRSDGFELIEGNWAAALAQGLNATVQTLTAHAGGLQAAATQIAAATQLAYLTAVASAGDSVKLPPAKAGMVRMVLNGTATSANIFGSNTTDKINGTLGSTAYALAGNKSVIFFCPKDGFWGAVLTA